MAAKPEASGDFRIAPFEAWATMWRRFGVKVEKPGKRGARIHVKNLTEGSSSEQLKTLFAEFGEILEADVKKDDNGKCRGFGYVILATEEAAAKAVAEMNGKTVDDKELNVVLVERKQDKGKGKDGKGKGKADDPKGKGKGKAGKGEKGKGKDGKGKGTGKGRGKGGTDYSMQQMNPYAYGMSQYGYGMPPSPYAYGMPGMYNPYMMGMAPYAYPMSPAYQAAAMGHLFHGAAAPTAPAAAAEAPGKGAKGKSKGKGKAKESSSGGAARDPPPPDKEFKGSLKSRSEKNGYGFITCGEAKDLYERDVWVDGDALPQDVKEGDKLSFNVGLSIKGHPQAMNVKSG
mmetsp:Transcript_76148/g.199723  ORF Transcript_76148/g.199723 Transcript_76148/m.199723 type:complete len:344 (+) Transcript_76148:86-1117(+)